MKFMRKKFFTLQSILLVICLLFFIDVVSLILSNRGCADSFGQIVYRGFIESVWSRMEANSKISTYLHDMGYSSSDFSVNRMCVSIPSLKKSTTYNATVSFTNDPHNEYQYLVPLKSGVVYQVPDIPTNEQAILVSRNRMNSETGKLILELNQYLKDRYHYQESDILTAYGSTSDQLYSYSVIFKDEPYIRYNFERKRTESSGNLHYVDYLLLVKDREYSEVKHKF